MKRSCFFLLLSSMAFGQGVIVAPQQVLKVVNGITSPVPNATITVCAANASGIPCFPVLTSALFKDAALTQPLTNPFSSDVNGNYQFAIAAGTYTVTNTAAGFGGYSYQITVGGGAGGSGVPAVGGNFGSYTFSVSGGIVSAVNNATGLLAFSGTDTAAVFNSVTSASATTGARLFFKIGTYPINSVTAETVSGCSNFGGSGNGIAYAMAFPSNTSYATAVQWLIEGEGTTVWTGELGLSTINANGVVFNVTSTAVSSVAAGSILVGFWQRPITNCTLTNVVGNNSNDLRFRNITVRFPTNQRGNEIAYGPYFAGTVGYDNTVADFSLPYNTIATGSAPVVGTYNSIGYTSTNASQGNYQDFTQTYAVGYNIGYDWAEHITAHTATAIYNNFAGFFGRAGGATVFHNGYVDHFVDQENLNGLQWGSAMAQGSRTDIVGLDFELGTANWYARTIGAMTEANPGNTAGLITYKFIVQGSGIVDGGSGQLFSSGGTNITTLGAPATFNLIPAVDSFTHPNSTIMGPGWLTGTWGGNFQLQSNQLQLIGTSVAGDIRNVTQPVNSDQFSKVTVNTIDSSASTFAEVTTNASGTAATRTYYNYFCSHVAAGGSGIIKTLAGTPTTLASQSSVVGCNAGDTIELRHIGTTLFAYRNGVLDTNFSPNPVTDSAISGGFPGIVLAQDTTTGVTATSWSGGSLPTMHGTDSIYNNATYHTVYNTIGNCQLGGATGTTSPAACVASASGSIAIPASQTSYTVNTTAVTAGSHIFVQQITDNSGISTATCNAGATTPIESARSVATSFTITLTSVASVTCIHYWIVN